jgi:hypothetical protein
VAHQCISPKRATEYVYRLTEGVARVLGIVLGPKEGEEGVAPVGSTWRGQRDIGKERDPFRLSEDAPKLLTFRVPEVERS